MHTTRTSANESTARRPARRRQVAGAAILAATISLVAAACSDDGTGSAADTTVSIASPATGSEVGPEFEVEFVPSVPIGEPDTGRQHIHLHFDGEPDYDIVYEETHTVSGLEPGEHRLVAVVANADHSETDVRSQEVVVTVTEGAAGPPAAAPAATPAAGGHDLGH
jgi:hypothetical protein